MCPIVPTFTCGFDRSNFSFAMSYVFLSLNLYPYVLLELPITALRSLSSPGTRMRTSRGLHLRPSPAEPGKTREPEPCRTLPSFRTTHEPPVPNGPVPRR